MKLNGAEIVVECLKKEKVDTLFCYIGGAVIPIFDQLLVRGKEIRQVRPVHEQGGVHAADGYARVTGKTGVMIVTSGPGATNAVTGIATAFMDSVPLVVISGQIAKSRIGSDAFQEADVMGMTLPLTKESIFVEDVAEIEDAIQRGFRIARSGRPGPVVIDIPIDIQMHEAEYIGKDTEWKEEEVSSLKSETVKRVAKMLGKARRPLLLTGGGVTFSKASDKVRSFIEKFRIPIVTTVMGRGLCDDEELYFGGVGMHGLPEANFGIQNCDLLIALGVRFSDRITGDKVSFAKNAEVVHVDIDEAELDKNIKAEVAVKACAGDFVAALADEKPETGDYREWLYELNRCRQENYVDFSCKDVIRPEYAVMELGKVFSEDTAVVADVGQNQMWVSQYYPFKQSGKFLTSGGLGTMGYALPAAVGAALGGGEVLMIAGDGGFQMNIQELATVSRYRLPVKMVVLDNARLGMVRQWQDLMCEGRYAGTVLNDNPDFVAITRAYGIPAIRVTSAGEFDSAVKWLADQEGAALLQIEIESGENVLPMVPSGKSLDDVLMEI